MLCTFLPRFLSLHAVQGAGSWSSNSLFLLIFFLLYVFYCKDTPTEQYKSKALRDLVQISQLKHVTSWGHLQVFLSNLKAFWRCLTLNPPIVILQVYQNLPVVFFHISSLIISHQHHHCHHQHHHHVCNVEVVLACPAECSCRRNPTRLAACINKCFVTTTIIVIIIVIVIAIVVIVINHHFLWINPTWLADSISYVYHIVIVIIISITNPTRLGMPINKLSHPTFCQFTQ